MHSALKKVIRQHPLNDSSKWDTDLRPPFFDSRAYQDRLDQIVGLNRSGKSIIRVIWGPESIGLFGVPRYWTQRYKDGEAQKYITVKRWYLEKRLERECYFDSWNAARYSLNEPTQGVLSCDVCGSTADPVQRNLTGGVDSIFRCPDCFSEVNVKGAVVDRGEPPDEFFTFFWMCAEHEAMDQEAGWPKCCERADKDSHRRCFGTFRNPNDQDLDMVARAVRQMESEPYHDPYAPLSAQDLALIESASGTQTERLARATEQRRRDITRDQRILSESGGTFHDVGSSFKRTQAGLVIP